MGRKQKTSFNETDVISASEIGQYHFCSFAWYLQKCGYEPISPMLEIGAKKHIELGNVMDFVQKNAKKSIGLAIVGYLLLLIGILIILLGVIL
jgi:hypothetical protein